MERETGLSKGGGVGEGGIPLQVARFSRGDVVSCHFVGRSTESESESLITCIDH